MITLASFSFISVQIMTDGRRFIDAASNNLSVFNTSITGDTGSYTCVATNSAGTSQYSVPVNFTDLMREYSITLLYCMARNYPQKKNFANKSLALKFSSCVNNYMIICSNLYCIGKNKFCEMFPHYKDSWARRNFPTIQ